MNEYLLLKFAHILAFVYWLGGDLGTFLASRHVIDRDLSPESRQVAMKIMLACDLAPRLAMPLILPTGMHLAVRAGALSLPDIALAGIWLAALLWFAMVMVLHLYEGSTFTARLSRVDFHFRIVVAVALSAYALHCLATGAGASWAAWKVLVFAAMVCCGIVIRIHFRPFVPAFARMIATGASASTDEAIARAIKRCRPWVWCIWGGLFISAALGTRLIG